MEFLARIVDKYFFSCLVLKMLRQSLSAHVFTDMFAELAGLKTVRMPQPVFFPETLTGHSFFTELPDNSRQ